MKDDITRETFHPGKHFSRVLMQQGRVQIDADFNEQGAIHEHYLRRLAADVIGPCGGPVRNQGFLILPPWGAQPVGDFVLSEGHYYVDGILCEIGATPVPATVSTDKAGTTIAVAQWCPDGAPYAVGQYLALFDGYEDSQRVVRITGVDPATRNLKFEIVKNGTVSIVETSFVKRIATYLTQPDFAPGPLAQGTYQAYLDVWERLITYVEDDSIREVALMGPDTAARAKVVWQVKLVETELGRSCWSSMDLREMLQPANLARLKARAQPARTSDDPCTIAPDARYRGPENQLYRVEVHTGNLADETGKPQPPTFKWSRENGSVVFPIRSGGGTNTLVLENLGRDDRFGLAAGDWVEVQDDDAALANVVSPMLKVQSIDRTRLTVVLSGTPNADIGRDAARHPLLRRWDQKQGDPAAGGLTLAADNAVAIPAGDPNPDTWLDLEDGVQVQFSNPEHTIYRTGDYWLIPARVATGDIEWPSETYSVGPGKNVSDKVALPPMGIVHHYAPLAVLKVGADNSVGVAGNCQSWFDVIAVQDTRIVQGKDQTAPTPPPPPPPENKLAPVRAEQPVTKAVKVTKPVRRPVPPQPPEKP